MTDKQYSDMGVPLSVGGGDFKPLDAGSYDFVIHGIIGLGLRPKTFEGKEMPPTAVIKIIFELPQSIRDDGQTQVIGYKINPSVSPKSNYYKLCKMLLGDRVSEATMSEFVTSKGMQQLLGQVGVLTVKHWDKDGRVIATIDRDGFSKLDPRLPKPEAKRPAFFFNPFAPDLATFKEILTAHSRKEVMEALNADTFPPELHQAYAKSLEDDAAKAKRATAKVEDTSVPFDVEGASTMAIE